MGSRLSCPARRGDQPTSFTQGEDWESEFEIIGDDWELALAQQRCCVDAETQTVEIQICVEPRGEAFQNRQGEAEPWKAEPQEAVMHSEQRSQVEAQLQRQALRRRMKLRKAGRMVIEIMRLRQQWSRLGSLCNLGLATPAQRNTWGRMGNWCKQHWVLSLSEGLVRKEGKLRRVFPARLPPESVSGLRPAMVGLPKLRHLIRRP